jgi:hypothetical protein
MSEPNTPEQRRWTAGAISLLALGLLILSLSGLCTSAALLSWFRGEADPDGLVAPPIILVVGGPFIVLGLVLVIRSFRK